MTLFLTDDELARELFADKGMRKAFLDQLPLLERRGFPQKDPLYGGRYWPAIKAFLDRRAGLRQDAPPGTADGEENLNASGRGRTRARAPQSG